MRFSLSPLTVVIFLDDTRYEGLRVGFVLRLSNESDETLGFHRRRREVMEYVREKPSFSSVRTTHKASFFLVNEAEDQAGYERIRKQWLREKEQIQSNEPLEIIYNYWDETDHRRVIQSSEELNGVVSVDGLKNLRRKLDEEGERQEPKAKISSDN
ncbi:hypothetical protein RJT34_29104 [Clitoria ternatea]|uniref:Uncharacterized protein n=1 Tax=Clitoria ternatea TaxID=43366 RepID=A0AAN9IBX7_CLITE